MTKGSEKIFVVGASGHGKVVADIVESQERFALSFFIDDNISLKGKKFFAYDVLGTRKDLVGLGRAFHALIAIGDNAVRCSLAAGLEESGYTFVSAVHPSAVCGRGVTIGHGTVVMAGAVINADSTVGEHSIVNTCCSIDHDCSIAKCVHLAPGTTLCGSVSVGERTLIGAGSTVLPNIVIGKDVIIGAGTTITEDISDGTVVVGPRGLEIKEK